MRGLPNWKRCRHAQSGIPPHGRKGSRPRTPGPTSGGREVPVRAVTTRTLERMNDLVAVVRAEGRYPSSKATDKAERTLAAWLQRRRERPLGGGCPGGAGKPARMARHPARVRRRSALAESSRRTYCLSLLRPGLARPQEHRHRTGTRLGSVAPRPAGQAPPRCSRPRQTLDSPQPSGIITRSLDSLERDSL